MCLAATTAVTLVVRPARIAAQVTAVLATVAFDWIVKVVFSNEDRAATEERLAIFDGLRMPIALRSMGASAQKQRRNK